MEIRCLLDGNALNQKRGITHINVHENYDDPFRNDFNIAMLYMDKAVSFGYNVQPICLPKSSSVDYSGKLAITTRSSYDDSTEYLLPSKFQQINIPIWTREQCARLPRMQQEKFSNNYICAGEYENGTRRTCTNHVS